jgi:rSAM/selenodomain-associated transferase 2
VIPALNEADRIAESVRSAREPGVEVIVADGGSQDATCLRAAEAGARVVSSSPGRSRQMQDGVKASDGDVILFLHADTRLPSGFADRVRGALADPAVAGGAFALRFDDSSLAMRLVAWGVRVRLAVMGLPYGDQAIFLRRSLLESIGGVPQVAIMEDLDLVKRIKERGRISLLSAPVTTSARRYRERGTLPTLVRNALALAAWKLGIDRRRVAAWYRR